MSEIHGLREQILANAMKVFHYHVEARFTKNKLKLHDPPPYEGNPRLLFEVLTGQERGPQIIYHAQLVLDPIGACGVLAKAQGESREMALRSLLDSLEINVMR